MLVDTKCGRLFVHVAGEGPDLVLWHSLLCDTGMWKEQLQVLAERYRVVSIDAPGHGRSANGLRLGRRGGARGGGSARGI